MSFKFRFESILQLRRRDRDEKGAAVGQAAEAIRRVDEQTDAIRAERDLMVESATANRVGSVSVDALLTGGRYDLQLRADLQALNETRETLLQELARRQQALAEAESELKRFERLKEREQVAYTADLQRREQFESDDAVGRRYTIGRRN